MQKKRVLVVDDEEDFLEIVKLNLEKTTRFNVLTSFSTENILPLVNRFRPEVILLDNLMP